jgi:hypothetical protein
MLTGTKCYLEASSPPPPLQNLNAVVSFAIRLILVIESIPLQAEVSLLLLFLLLFLLLLLMPSKRMGGFAFVALLATSSSRLVPKYPPHDRNQSILSSRLVVVVSILALALSGLYVK